MLKQTMTAFAVFMLFVIIGVYIFYSTQNLTWIIPPEEINTLRDQGSADWVVTTGIDGDFEVRMPVPSQQSTDHVKVPGSSSGETIRHDLYTAAAFEDRRYVVGVVYLPETLNIDEPITILDAEKDSLIEGDTGSRIVDYQTIFWDGHYGIDFKVHRGSDTLACRFLLVKHTLYELILQHNGGIEGKDFPQREYDLFIDSFRLIKKK